MSITESERCHISQPPLTRFHSFFVMQEDNDHDVWILDLHPSFCMWKDATSRYREVGEGEKGQTHKQPCLQRASGLAYTCCQRIERCWWDYMICVLDSRVPRDQEKPFLWNHEGWGERSKLNHVLLINCPLGKGKWERGKTNIPNYNLTCLLSTEIRRKRLLNRAIKYDFTKSGPAHLLENPGEIYKWFTYTIKR